MKSVSNFKNSIFIRRVKRITQILQTVSNIKVSSHNEDIVNVDFSILKIL